MQELRSRWEQLRRNRQVLLLDAEAEVQGQTVTDRPGILDEECMVVVDGWLVQNGRKVYNSGISVLARAATPFCRQ